MGLVEHVVRMGQFGRRSRELENNIRAYRKSNGV